MRTPTAPTPPLPDNQGRDWGQYIGPAAQIGGDVLGYFGQQSTNASNAAQAREQMAFQERMSNTSYQRAVEDMKKAGLNPGLAYQQGGATTPSGAQATMQNAAASFKGSAQGAAATYASMAQNQATQAQTRKTEAETNQLNLESIERLTEIQTRNALNRVSAKTSEIQGTNIDWQNRLWRETFATRVEQLKRDVDLSIASSRDKNAAALLSELASPSALNAANAARTWFGRSVSPYLNDAKTAADIFKVSPIRFKP